MVKFTVICGDGSVYIRDPKDVPLMEIYGYNKEKNCVAATVTDITGKQQIYWNACMWISIVHYLHIKKANGKLKTPVPTVKSLRNKSMNFDSNVKNDVMFDFETSLHTKCLTEVLDEYKLSLVLYRQNPSGDIVPQLFNEKYGHEYVHIMAYGLHFELIIKINDIFVLGAGPPNLKNTAIFRVGDLKDICSASASYTIPKELPIGVSTPPRNIPKPSDRCYPIDIPRLEKLLDIFEPLKEKYEMCKGDNRYFTIRTLEQSIRSATCPLTCRHTSDQSIRSAPGNLKRRP